ncbi:MAG: acyl-CoA dehydrogenase [Pseudomonas sp.]|nr:acyl-CoA dehydrogenase [Pseudomonas sp.]
MSHYQAPVKDIMFLLNNVFELSELSELPALADFSPDLIGAVLEEAGKFATGVLAPLNSVGDQQGCSFDDGQVSTADGWIDAYKQFCDGGWMGLALPEAYGGQGLPNFIAMPVNEMWNSANLSFEMLHTLIQGGSEIFLSLGTDVQKARYLEQLVSGNWTVAMALTEPAAGSDLGAITTRAILNEDGSYQIKGQKIFISYGEHDVAENIIHLVLARTPDAPPGGRGISLFAVPKYRINADGGVGELNDVACMSIEHKTGLHGSPTCSMSYGDNNACFGELIGTENRGLSAMFILMNAARLSTGLQGVAIGEVGYQRALEYAQERVQGTDITGKKRVPIVEHPDVARMLLSIRSQVMGLRSLSYLIAARIDKASLSKNEQTRQSMNSSVALLTPVFKAFATESANLMAGTTIQIFGGMGFIEETGVAQLMRDSRITTIYEGTTGIQAKDLLFRKIAADKGAALSDLLAEITQDAEVLASIDSFTSLAEVLQGICAEVARMSERVVQAEQDDQLGLYAGSLAMLEAIGILCCSWQLGCVALTAHQKLQEGDDPAYHENLIALTRFYFAHFTPRVLSLTQTFFQADAGVKDYQFSVR